MQCSKSLENHCLSIVSVGVISSQYVIRGWLEKNTELKKGFGAIVDCEETEAPRAKRFLK